MLLLRFIVTWWKPYVLKIRQARIQEFSSGGGVQLFENFWQAKKKKKKKRGEKTGFRLFFHSFPSAEVWLKSTFQKIIYIQIYFR